MQIKDPISGFTYCPRCGKPLALQNYNHRLRKLCAPCGFVDFHNPVPAAGAIVLRDGKLLLVKRAEDPYKHDWCIPAGFMEWDESPAECAQRELKEETGLEIKCSGIFNVYSGTNDPRTNAILVLYFCEIVGGDLVAGDDASELAFFSRAEVPANIAFLAHRQAIADLSNGYPRLFP